MTSHHCLRIGSRLLCSEQIISALVEYKLLEPLIEQIILDHRLSQVTLSEQDITSQLGEEIHEPISEEYLQRWCKQHQITWDYFNLVMLRDLRIEKFKQVYFQRQVESEFIQLRAELDQISYSCLQVNDSFLAQELYFQLHDDGVDFAQLARRYSLGAERQTGGRVERAALSSLPPEVAHILLNGKIAEVYGPIAVADLFWIVRPEYRLIASLTEDTRTLLTERGYHRWLQTQVQTLMAQPDAIVLEFAPTAAEKSGGIPEA